MRIGRNRHKRFAGIPTTGLGLGGNLSFWFQNNVGVAVGQWDDQSSNNRHATQGTSGDQAALAEGGLDFESGDGDHYDLASQVTISAEEGFTIFLVCKVESVASNMVVLGLNSNAHFLQLNGGGDEVGIRLASVTTTVTPSTSNLFHTDAGRFLLTIQREAGDTAGGGTLGHINLWRNGAKLALDSVAENDGDAEFISMGVRNADRFFDGIIHEMMMVEAGKDTADIRNRIHDYLNSKHGLS